MAFPPPIFILASPFSFTSIVGGMIGQHPDAYGVPEVNLFAKDTLEELFFFMKGPRQILLHGLLRTVAQLYGGEQTRETIDMARRWIFKRWEKSTAEVYHELCERVAPLRIVDKSPLNSSAENPEILERLHQAFPDAYYLHLLRHPMTQGKSWLKIPTAFTAMIALNSVDYSTKPASIDPQFAWYDKQRRILDFLKDIPPERQIRLRGEDILNNPHLYLEKICRWLELPWSEEIYATMLKTEASSYACMGPYGAQWGNNPGYQTSPAFRYRHIDIEPLEGLTLPWRWDGKGLYSEVIELARSLGYE